MRRRRLRRLIPSALARSSSALLVALSQRRTASLIGTDGECMLVPQRAVDHYYHFLFDLSLPIFCLARRCAPEARLLVQAFGPLTGKFAAIAPACVRVLPSETEPTGAAGARAILRSMNIRRVRLAPSTLEAFRSHVFRRLGVDQDGTRRLVLLIERRPPEGYYETQSTAKGGGSSRRSIVNHDALRDRLEAVIRAPFEFRNVRLEDCSLAHQCELFRDAALVIGQHGAGLANCLWCTPRATLVELNHRPNKNHFRLLASTRRMPYAAYRTAGAHARISVDDFCRWLRGQTHVLRDDR